MGAASAGFSDRHLTGFKETEIGPIPADWEVVLLAQAEEERAEADEVKRRADEAGL